MKQVYQTIALETEGHYLVGLEPQIFLDKLNHRCLQVQIPLEVAFEESAEGASCTRAEKNRDVQTICKLLSDMRV
jgi:hypothetical protein